MPSPDHPQLTVDLTAKIAKVTAEVELYDGERLVGAMPVDRTPETTDA